MSLREGRMIEVVGRITRQADLLHDAPRTHIARHRERYDPLEPQDLEGKVSYRARPLGSVAGAPVLAGKAPADLHSRRERSLEAGDGQPDEPSERGHPWDLDRPQSEPMALEVRLDQRSESVTLFARQRPLEVLHDSRIGIESGKGRAVFRQPLPQLQPVRSEIPWRVHVRFGRVEVAAHQVHGYGEAFPARAVSTATGIAFTGAR